MRRARTASLGSASASGADSSQHAASSVFSASASDIDASQHSASQQYLQHQQQQQQAVAPGGITRMRSRGSSITQVRACVRACVRWLGFGFRDSVGVESGSGGRRRRRRIRNLLIDGLTDGL